jgi:hypothetical protein
MIKGEFFVTEDFGYAGSYIILRKPECVDEQ